MSRRLRRFGLWWTRLGLLLVVATALSVLVAAIPVVAVGYAGRAVDAGLAKWESLGTLPAQIDRPALRSRILAADGTTLAQVHAGENRIVVPLGEVPDHTQQAVIATEDQAFYRHPGINHEAIVRQALTNAAAGEITGGGSTITQQYVKNVMLTPERTLERKLVEAKLALELEQRLSKEEILERYLNEVYLANGVYGFGTAAEFYFGKHVSELTVAESALLAGMIRTPEGNDPIDNPDAALARRNIVLRQMHSIGAVDDTQLEVAVAQPLELDVHPLPEPAEPFVVDHAIQQLLDDPRLGDTRQERRDLLFRGGVTIHTTLDLQRQHQAEAAIAERLQDPTQDPLAALVSVEPGTGDVVAMAVGPKSYGVCEQQAEQDAEAASSSQDTTDLGAEQQAVCTSTKVNPAAPGAGGSGRQPGSAFKPFVVVSALEHGISTQRRMSVNSGQPIAGCRDGNSAWRPSNYSLRTSGTMNMVDAVRTSNNVYHAKLAGDVGPANVAEVAVRLGLSSPRLAEIAQLPRDDARQYCAISLGAAETFPVEMAGAYAALAADGLFCEPHLVSQVVARDGTVLLDEDGSCRQALDPWVARTATELLQGPPANGTATRAQLADERDQAGKTGTTDDSKDAWFVGYVPQLATAAWIGYEQPKPMRGILGLSAGRPMTGGSVPAELWLDYMQPVVAQLPAEPFVAPTEVSKVRVPQLSGRSRSSAEAVLADLGLESVERVVSDWRPAGTVVGAEPAQGAFLDIGSLVTLDVSDGEGEPPPVPDVTGMQLQEAAVALEQAGHMYAVVDREVSPDDDQVLAAEIVDGQVVAQDPGPNSRRLPGEVIDLTVVRVTDK